MRVDQCTFNYYIRYFGVIMIHGKILRTVNSLVPHEIYYVSNSRVSPFGEFIALISFSPNVKSFIHHVCLEFGPWYKYLALTDFLLTDQQPLLFVAVVNRSRMQHPLQLLGLALFKLPVEGVFLFLLVVVLVKHSLLDDLVHSYFHSLVLLPFTLQL